MFSSFEDLNYFFDRIYSQKDNLLTHGSHLLFRNSTPGYKQMQVTVPSGRKVRCYVHQVIASKKFNMLSFQDGMETSHLCHIKNCVNPAHIAIEPRHINNNRIHCSRERNDVGNASYCVGHGACSPCVSQD